MEGQNRPSTGFFLFHGALDLGGLERGLESGYRAAMPLIRFNSQTARAAALRGAEVRRRKKAAELLRQAEERERIEREAREPLPADAYLAKRIARIRCALDRYDDMLLVETDPQKAQWLATVTSKLAEQERVLCGRPQPGQLRPATPPRRSPSSAPIIPE